MGGGVNKIKKYLLGFIVKIIHPASILQNQVRCIILVNLFD